MKRTEYFCDKCNKSLGFEYWRICPVAIGVLLRTELLMCGIAEVWNKDRFELCRECASKVRSMYREIEDFVRKR